MEIDIFNIKKILPQPIKKRLGHFYDIFFTKIDKEVVKNLQEYYGLSRKNILHLLRLSGTLSVDFWRCLNPKNDEDVKMYYEENPFYIFELIFWHSTGYQRKLRQKFITKIQGMVLDYGGGVGDLCIEIAKKGFKVDYADLPGRTFEFAKWLFSKKGYNIEMINLNKEKLSKKYDTILCIDVIEHVKNPELLLKNFIEHLSDNGRLIITALHPDVSEEKPMHFEMKFNPEKYLNSLGMAKANEDFFWVKISNDNAN